MSRRTSTRSRTSARNRDQGLSSPSAGGHAPTEPEKDKKGPNNGPQGRSKRQRGNQASRPQNSPGSTYYTGRSPNPRQNGGRQNSGNQSGGQQNNDANLNGASDQSSGGPNRPNRNSRPDRSRNSGSTSSSGSSTSASFLVPGSDDDNLDDNRTSRGAGAPGHPEDGSPDDSDSGDSGSGDDGPGDDGPDASGSDDDGSDDDISGDDAASDDDPDGEDSDDRRSGDRSLGSDVPDKRGIADWRSDSIGLPRSPEYGPLSSVSSATIEDPYSTESATSEDTVELPAMSPLLGAWDPNAEHEPNPPGTYEIVIGRWVIPTRYNGNHLRQNVVVVRIDAIGRMTFPILERDYEGRRLPLPRFPNGRPRRLATDASLQARLAPHAAQQGYFEYAIQYRGGGANSRRLIDTEIAVRQWDARRQSQVAEHERRRNETLAGYGQTRTREEFEELERVDRRRTIRRARRREGAAGVRRALRRLNRRWIRRRERYGYRSFVRDISSSP